MLIERFRTPPVRVDVGTRLAERGVASAMIDVSDGLVQDLDHICASSGVGAIVLTMRVPLSTAYTAVVGDDPTLALTGGEDYELLFTVPPRRLEALAKLVSRRPCPVTFIGQIVARPRGVRLQDLSGVLRRPERGGYEHFRVM